MRNTTKAKSRIAFILATAGVTTLSMLVMVVPRQCQSICSQVGLRLGVQRRQ